MEQTETEAKDRPTQTSDLSRPLVLRLRRREPLPPRLPPILRRRNTQNRRRNNARLRSKRARRSVPLNPHSLEVHDTEAAQHTRRQDPGGGERGVVGEDVEDVGRDGGGGAEGAETEHAPAEGDADPGELVLEGLAEED